MKRRLGERAAVIELIAPEDETQLVGGDALLVPDLALHHVDGVARLDLEGKFPARERLDKQLAFSLLLHANAIGGEPWPSSDAAALYPAVMRVCCDPEIAASGGLLPVGDTADCRLREQNSRCITFQLLFFHTIMADSAVRLSRLGVSASSLARSCHAASSCCARICPRAAATEGCTSPS